MISTSTHDARTEHASPSFLIIDDDEIDQISCQRALRQGFGSSARIDTAGGWQQAIAAIEEHAHDIYLIDHNLSGGTGLDLIQRYCESMQDRVFILFTGQDNREIDIAATAAGAADYIVKSEITATRLERSVRFALAMNRQKQELLEMARALETANEAAQKTANELKITQNELRDTLAQANASEKQKRLVLDALPITVAYIDRDERYALVNKLACEWCRKSEAEIVGQSVDALHDQSFGPLKETLLSVLQDETAIVEKLIRYPDDIERDVKIYATPDTRPDGSIAGWYTMTEDISERRKLDNLKKEFITTVSHELRTPLTSLFGSVSLMRETASGDSAQLIDIAHRNCERLMDLVNDLLDMEKIETGQLAFDEAPVSVRNVVQDAIELNAAYGARFKVAFETSTEIPDLFVTGNYQSLLQVLANFLSNAAKSSPEGSKVSVSAFQTGKFVEIAVQDSGCGISAQFHDVIFEKFVKIDTLNSNQVPGTGLGLSICRKIVEQHNGEIGFESALGEGSTFFFKVPATEVSETAQLHPIAHRIAAGGSNGFNANGPY